MSTPMTGRSEYALREPSSPPDEEGLSAETFIGFSNSAPSELTCHGHGASPGIASSLPTGTKGHHFHGVQKGTRLGKHLQGRGFGRACTLAHLEVAAEHIGQALALTSPRLSLRSPGRKKSPIRWFPRKKSESYLERKIRMLQVKEGHVASLDETLGAANLHVSRIEREKLAAQAAAAEAMDARKAALVEASWCRILKVAGIPCQLAISELQNAEKKAAAALAEAENHGVVLQHDAADQREAASEAVTAALETAFDVDKLVTAAIKAALQRLRQFNERACDLQDVTNVEFTSSEVTDSYYANDAADSQSDTEIKGECKSDEKLSPTGKNIPRKDLASKPLSKDADDSKARRSLVFLMESRIRELSVEHHTALAGIVATRGLSELLKDQSLEQELNGRPSGLFDSKTLDDGCSPKKGHDLGSIRVKHVSRLQRDVQAAKETNRHLHPEVEKRSGGRLQRTVAHVDSLDKILIKHVCKLEKEKLAAQATRRTPPRQKLNSVAPEETLGLAELLSTPHERNETRKEVKKESQTFRGGGQEKLSEVSKTAFCTGDIGSILIKPESMLEEEKQAAYRMQESTDVQNGDLGRIELKSMDSNSFSTPENATNKLTSLDAGSLKMSHCQDLNEIPDLGSILIKHVSRLEKEKQMALALQDKSNTPGRQVGSGQQLCEAGLKDILVKRLSKLEVEKARLSGSGMITTRGPSAEGRIEELDSKENLMTVQSTEATRQRAKTKGSRQMDSTWSGMSLQDALSSVKVTKVQMNAVKPLNGNLPRRKSLREKQMEEEWGGLSLGTALKPHVSKLEKEQAAWKHAEEEARQRQR